MNDTLTQFAKKELKEGLSQCTDAQIHLFKKMYSFDDLDLPIDDVVDNIPDDKLDWAMLQVERTLSNNESKKEAEKK